MTEKKPSTKPKTKKPRPKAKGEATPFDRSILSEFHFNDIVLNKIEIDSNVQHFEGMAPFEATIEYTINKGEIDTDHASLPIYISYNVQQTPDDLTSSDKLFMANSEFTAYVCCHSDELTKLIINDHEEASSFFKYWSLKETWDIFITLMQSSFNHMNIPPVCFPRIPPPESGTPFTFESKLDAYCSRKE